MSTFHRVWSNNLQSELISLKNHLLDFPIVSIDTEFPGLLRNTPRHATEQEYYENVRFNVTNLKLIQLGLTLFNANGSIGGTWEFNFSDFDREYDLHNAESISLLIDNGLDFEKLKKDGIAMRDFSSKFVKIFMNNSEISKFVTFHGMYDIAYFLKAISWSPFPATVAEFAKWASFVLGDISDLKHMARFCGGLKNGNVGLEKLGELMKVKRVGQKHQAGSDSLLTAEVYVKMKQQLVVDPNVEGYLYGLRTRIAKIVIFTSCPTVFTPVYYHHYWIPPCSYQLPYYLL